MRVLAAVLADARHVALDVAGLERARGRTAGRTAGSACPLRGPAVLDRRHRLSGPLRVAGAGDHRPGLRRWRRSGTRRSAPSRAACRRRSRPGGTSRRPRRAPPARLAAPRPAPGTRPPARCRRAARPGRRTRVSVASDEPAVPDALALAVGADLVHAVVPVAGAHQRQAVRPEPVAVLQRAHAVLVDRPGLVAHGGQVVVLLLVGPSGLAPAGTAPARPAARRRRLR